MRKKKVTKEDMDQELLKVLFQAEKEWKQIQKIIKQSVNPSEYAYVQEACARSKYLFLLREARHRNVHALSFKGNS